MNLKVLGSYQNFQRIIFFLMLFIHRIINGYERKKQMNLEELNLT